jgi:hypothetical protein
MSSDFDPLPEERGDLQPPRRRPPTAVGTATPPPPGPLPLAQRHIPWSRIAVALLVFASPAVLGVVSWLLIRRSEGWWMTAAGWLVAVLAGAIATVLTYVAVVLPIRDYVRTRAADRLSHAR